MSDMALRIFSRQLRITFKGEKYVPADFAKKYCESLVTECCYCICHPTAAMPVVNVGIAYQVVQNTAACLDTSTRLCEYIMPVLRQLHSI